MGELRRTVGLVVVLGLLLVACGGGQPAGGDRGAEGQTGPPTTGGASPDASTASGGTDGESGSAQAGTTQPARPGQVLTGAEVLASEGFARLAGMRVGVIANQTSRVGEAFLIDVLHQTPGVELAAIFAPEHGVRGDAFAGEAVGDTVDEVTGVPVYSLYERGTDFTPTPDELAGLDVLIYDLQDVGTRFYTYISTMARAMEAAARAGVPFMVLDRPNPQGGDVVEGFTRTPDQTSFVSELPIPARYGLTAGELAAMIQGEGWKDVADLDLRVVEMAGWDRAMRWDDTGRAWVPPSFGLPTVETALVYPGTVLFETLVLSFGGGTEQPFTRLGAPWVEAEQVVADLRDRQLDGVAFEAITYVPAPHPDRPQYADRIGFLGQEISSVQMSVTDPQRVRSVELGVHLVDAFAAHGAARGRAEVIERGPFFDLLAGTPVLRQQLGDGTPATVIIEGMRADSAAFELARQPYLLY